MTSEAGTYALLCRCRAAASIPIGRLGVLQAEPGWFVYVGSALGPGGLQARLAHHFRPAAKPHWHIDYLRRGLALHSVWYCAGPRRREHQWAAALRRLQGVVPLPRFGASDCACESHLYYFRARPSLRAFADIMGHDHAGLKSSRVPDPGD